MSKDFTYSGPKDPKKKQTSGHASCEDDCTCDVQEIKEGAHANDFAHAKQEAVQEGEYYTDAEGHENNKDSESSNFLASEGTSQDQPLHEDAVGETPKTKFFDENGLPEDEL